MTTNHLYLAISLIDSIEDKNLSDLKILLETKSANPNILLPERGITPFHFIVGNECEEFALEVTKLFLFYGGNPNIRSDEGMTPVHIAAAWGKLNLLRLLLDNGGKSYLLDYDCKTPLDYAKESQHHHIVNYLHSTEEFTISRPLKFNKIDIHTSECRTEDCVSDQSSRNSLTFCLSHALNPVSWNKRKQYVEEWCEAHSDYNVFLNKTYVKNKDFYSDDISFLNDTFLSNLYDNSKIIDNNKIICNKTTNTMHDIIVKLQNCCINDETKENNTLNKVLNIENKYSYESLKTETFNNLTSFNISGINPIHSHVSLEKSGCNKMCLNYDKTNNMSFDHFHLNNNNSNSNEYLTCNTSVSAVDNDSNKSSSRDCFNECILSFDLSSTNSLITSDQIENMLDNKYTNFSNKNILISSNQYFPKTLEKTDSGSKDISLQISSTGSSITHDSINMKKISYECNLNVCDNYHFKCSDIQPSSIENSTQKKLLFLMSTVSDNLQNMSKIANKYNLALQLHNTTFVITSDETENESESKLSTEDIKNSNSKLNSCKNYSDININLDKTESIGKSHRSNSEIKEDIVENSYSQNYVCSHNNSKNLLSQLKNNNSLIAKNKLKPKISISEEYRYTDDENGVVLIEKRRLVTPFKSQLASEKFNSSPESILLPTDLEYDTDTLRGELTYLGHPPGPITKTTKRVYLKKLIRLHYNETEKLPPPVSRNQNNRVYSLELEKTLRSPEWYKDLAKYASLEQEVSEQFSNPNVARKWREGVSKSSFTYLLLDPRVTRNLPVRSEEMLLCDIWKEFLSAIFYVGKGKRSRPYAHLYQAVSSWDKRNSIKDKKIQYIFDIWKDQCGVVCLHVFQNIIPVEAYTREAAMIDVIGLKNLQNNKSGNYYGIAATWPCKKKKLLGVYLLYRAMQVFLNEGERQLRPQDIE